MKWHFFNFLVTRNTCNKIWPGRLGFEEGGWTRKSSKVKGLKAENQIWDMPNAKQEY
jgi:hypothetical protein